MINNKYMRTIVFINEKGGVGKTSLCFNAAWEISKRKKVLLIDLDGQRANLSFFCNVKKTDEMKTIFNVMMQGEKIKNTIINIKKNLDLIPANDLVSDLSEKAAVPKFLQALRDVREDYDYCFMDVSPSPNRGQTLALAGSDYVVIPMLPDVTSLESNNGVKDTINFIKKNLNPDLRVLGIVFNRNESRTVLQRDVKNIVDDMAEALDTRIFDASVRDTVLLKENVGAHVGITEYAPSSDAAMDYIKLTFELEKEVFANG